MNGDVTVQEVMDRAFVGVSESDGLRETVELMLEEEVESVLVLRGQEPVGVLTERDVLATVVSRRLDGTVVSEAMTETVPTVDPDLTLTEAAGELSAQSTQRLVVTDGTAPVGILTEHDLLNTSPFQQEAGGPPESGGEPADRKRAMANAMEAQAATSERAGTETATATGSFEEQAICEACSSFTRDLSAFNGQLLCADCRDM